MEDLADEVLLMIFCYLGMDDLVRSRRVCLRWKRLASDSTLWGTPRGIRALGHPCHALTGLAGSEFAADITSLVAGSSSCASCCARCRKPTPWSTFTSLHTLALNLCGVAPLVADMRMLSLQHLPALQSLNVAAQAFGSAALLGIERLTSLRILRLVETHNPDSCPPTPTSPLGGSRPSSPVFGNGDLGLAQPALAALSSLTRLTSLALGTFATIASLTFLSTMTQLRSLTVTAPDGIADATASLHVIAALPLTSLDLSGTPLPAAPIENVLLQLVGLRALDLSGCDVSDHTIASIASPYLETLRVARNARPGHHLPKVKIRHSYPPDEKSKRHVAKQTSPSPLDHQRYANEMASRRSERTPRQTERPPRHALFSYNVTDVGMQAIAESAMASVLQELDVSGSAVSDEGVSALLAECLSLRKLRLDDCTAVKAETLALLKGGFLLGVA